MAATMAIPTFNLDLAPPGKMRMPSIMGGGVEGGRTLSGVVNVADLTGGGLVSVRYSDIGLGNLDPAAQRYWSQLAGILNSRVRSIIVPLMTDFICPGSFTAVLGAAASVNASTLSVAVSGLHPTDDLLAGGEWFGIRGPNLSFRAHVVTDIDTAQNNGDGTAGFTVGISPPLRESYGAGTPLNFIRPRCLMRLAPGAQITSDVEPGWWTTPEVEFVESFGTT